MVIKNHPLSRHIFFYGVYNTLLIIGHLLLVSIITFVHFLLDHRLGVIEDWIRDNAWEIVICSKILALFSTYLFLAVKSDSRNLIRDFLHKYLSVPDKKFWVILTVFIILTLFLGGPVPGSNSEWQFGRFFVSYLGTFTIFKSDNASIQTSIDDGLRNIR